MGFQASFQAPCEFCLSTLSKAFGKYVPRVKKTDIQKKSRWRLTSRMTLGPCAANIPCPVLPRAGGAMEPKHWGGRGGWEGDGGNEGEESSEGYWVWGSSLEVRRAPRILPAASTSKDISFGNWSSCCRRRLCLASGSRAMQNSGSPSCHNLTGWSSRTEETNDHACSGWLHPRWLRDVTLAEQGPVAWWVQGFNPSFVTHWWGDLGKAQHSTSLGIPGFPHRKRGFFCFFSCSFYYTLVLRMKWLDI